ncbi:hypothetical protein DL93DRAFT_308073 [Clavulina sp. PMI_390]|nr:hypothetical protein DL93DRAFT_308073 [Clavulina sp. PMI_390]
MSTSTSSMAPVSFYEDESLPDTGHSMPPKHRSAVNANWEEAGFEAGLQALDNLRSPRYLPTIAQIRQVIYLSVYPHQEAVELPMNASPRKRMLKGQRQERLPSPESSRLAANLLVAFSRTNGPDCVFRAIPHYPDPDAQPAGAKSVKFKDEAAGDQDFEDELADSPVGKPAQKLVGSALDCWDLLKPDAIDVKWEEPDDVSAPMVVGDHAWGLLDALISIMEEEDGSETGVSQWLIRHIPRVKGHLLWDFERPLRVVFSCMMPDSSAPGQPYNPHRASLGVRLLSLMLKATLYGKQITPSIAQHFVQLCAKHARQHYVTGPQIQYLLMSLATLSWAHSFIICFISEFLKTSTVIHDYAPPDAKGASRPRARPRPRVSGRDLKDSPPTQTEQKNTRERYSLPSRDIVLRNLASSSVAPHFAVALEDSAGELTMEERLELDAQKSAIAKMHLIQCLHAIFYPPSSSVVSSNEGLSSPGAITKSDWISIVRDGRLNKAVHTGFAHVVGLAPESPFQAVYVPLSYDVLGDVESELATSSGEPIPMEES